MNIQLKNRDEKWKEHRRILVTEYDVVHTLFLRWCYQVDVRALVIRWTALFCSTWSRVPRPSMIPDFTVSLDWANKLNGARAWMVKRKFIELRYQLTLTVLGKHLVN